MPHQRARAFELLAQCGGSRELHLMSPLGERFQLRARELRRRSRRGGGRDRDRCRGRVWDLCRDADRG
jgi:hypothetical protein